MTQSSPIQHSETLAGAFCSRDFVYFLAYRTVVSSFLLLPYYINNSIAGVSSIMEQTRSDSVGPPVWWAPHTGRWHDPLVLLTTCELEENLMTVCTNRCHLFHLHRMIHAWDITSKLWTVHQQTDLWFDPILFLLYLCSCIPWMKPLCFFCVFINV